MLYSLKAVSVISAPEDSSTNEVSSNYSWMVDRVGCNTDASPLESEHTIDEKEERFFIQSIIFNIGNV